ncbi:MAG: hypothetical protein C0606_07920 [Hyphomicrobiales bacterium]|nr:MAG: hypothetical protein C0606_07920 [Hyphomicrobiales bacterium]
MIDLYPFAGFPVFVLGLGAHGCKAAEALRLSGAEVMGWDDDPANRRAAAANDVVLQDGAEFDWREPVSLIVEAGIAHGDTDPHPMVAAAREAGCEVISDAELLARAERDSRYVGLVSEAQESAALDLLAHALKVSGRECEIGGDQDRPLLGLHPLGNGGIYGLAMPPVRLDITLSITFDVAVLLDIGAAAKSVLGADAAGAARLVFHRQTGGNGAIVNVDDRETRQIAEALQAAKEQVVIPVSGRARVPGGVYVAGGVLYDDIAGNADAIVGLDLPAGKDGEDAGRLAAAVYASLLVLDVPAHAAMASIRGYFASE